MSGNSLLNAIESLALVFALVFPTSVAANDLETSLIDAAKAGDLTTVRALLNRGVSPNAVDKEHDSALELTAYAGHIAVARELVAHGADVNSRDRFGLTALHAAAYGGQIEMLEFLMSHGTDKNALSTDRETPLMKAEMSGHIDASRLLLSRGAKDEEPSCGDEFCMDVRMLLYLANRANVEHLAGAHLSSDAFGENFQGTLIVKGAGRCVARKSHLLKRAWTYRCSFGDDALVFYKLMNTLRVSLPGLWHEDHQKFQDGENWKRMPICSATSCLNLVFNGFGEPSNDSWSDHGVTLTVDE